MIVAVLCLGLLNHNPGNISPKNLRGWHGAIGRDAYGHARFRTRRDGILAIRENLIAYWTKHHLNTCREIATRWASPRISKADLADYIATLDAYTGAQPDEPLDMTDPDTLQALGHGIAREETGTDPYPERIWASVFR